MMRANTIHTKVVNMYKSMGFEVQMDGLTEIEVMLTGFNKIVLQSGVINKYFLCFDLPVY